MLIDVKWTTLIDFPGEVATTVFTHGCNLRCPFCHNYQLVINNPNPLISLKELEMGLRKRKNFITGVAFTGGEPLLSEDLIPIATIAKNLGLKTKLDTNGTLPNQLQNVLHLFDYIAMDLKAPPLLYNKACGVNISFDVVKESIYILMNSNVLYEFRTTLVPGITDQEKHIDLMGQEIEGARKWALQRFIPDNTLHKDYKKFLPISPTQANILKNFANKYVKDVELRI